MPKMKFLSQGFQSKVRAPARRQTHIHRHMDRRDRKYWLIGGSLLTIVTVDDSCADSLVMYCNCRMTMYSNCCVSVSSALRAYSACVGRKTSVNGDNIGHTI